MAEGVPFGRYLLIKRLAAGGMAELFLARAEQGRGRLVALKRMLPTLSQDPAFPQMFLDEARIAAQLAHPYLIQIYEVGAVEGTLFIAMEYVHGLNLSNALDDMQGVGGPFPWQIATRIGIYLCEALQYAHERPALVQAGGTQ